MVECLDTIKKKILVVCETYSSIESGAQSARATVKYLKSLDYSVGVFAPDAETSIKDVAVSQFKFSPKKKWHCFLYLPILKAEFNIVLKSFSPDYVLFVGSANSNRFMLSRIARKNKIKTAFLFYINDYFCHVTYAGRANGPCDACIKHPLLAPGYFRCINFKKIPSFMHAALRRFLLAKEIRKADAVLNYGITQASIAKDFGVNEQKLSIIGFQFDPSDLSDCKVSDEGYFALTGGSSVQKGWNNLSAIFDNLESDLKVKVSFKSKEIAESALNKFNLKKYVDEGRLELIIGLYDRTDYLKFISGSRAVIIPSNYYTTGEFVMLESIFLGKPIHVFNVGVHKDMFVDKRDAMVSEIGNFDDFARKMDEVHRDEVIRRGLQRASLKMAGTLVTRTKIELLGKVFG